MHVTWQACVTSQDRKFVVLVLVAKDPYWLFLKPINNLLACMHHKIIVLLCKLIKQTAILVTSLNLMSIVNCITD